MRAQAASHARPSADPALLELVRAMARAAAARDFAQIRAQQAKSERV